MASSGFFGLIFLLTDCLLFWRENKTRVGFIRTDRISEAFRLSHLDGEADQLGRIGF